MTKYPRTDAALKAIITDFPWTYWNAVLVRSRPAQIVTEMAEWMLANGYKAPRTIDGLEEADYEAADDPMEEFNRVVLRGEPFDIKSGDMKTSAIGLMVVKMLKDGGLPSFMAGKPSDGYTQADLDAAEKRGYDRCKADVARLRA